MHIFVLLAFLASRVVASSDIKSIRADNYELDRSLLAAQVGGLVAAYVGFVAITLSLLLFVGRRLRRTVHASNYTLQVEMMKPFKPPSTVDPSPVTPISPSLPSPNRPNGFDRSWSSLGRSARTLDHPSNNGSVATIDETVVATDRRRAQEQMEMLYAAVMEYDEQKEHAKESGSSSGGHSHNYSLQSRESVVTNPFTDRSSRVLEEPSQANEIPTSPRSSNSRLSRRLSSLSLFSSNTRTSAGSGKIRSPRLPLRKLSISSPLASPDPTTNTSYGEDQPPLTPRLYNPPPPPAPPIHVSAPPPAKSTGMRRTPAPPPLSLSAASHAAYSARHAGPSQGSLPFRDAYGLQSAPPTKTTILERPAKQMNGPRTGMPTPYSPYMPFTPVTPLTPSRIVTKRERKREGKESGLHVLNEDDIVKDDGDMWGY